MSLISPGQNVPGISSIILLHFIQKVVLCCPFSLCLFQNCIFLMVRNMQLIHSQFTAICIQVHIALQFCKLIWLPGIQTDEQYKLFPFISKPSEIHCRSYLLQSAPTCNYHSAYYISLRQKYLPCS